MNQQGLELSGDEAARRAFEKAEAAKEKQHAPPPGPGVKDAEALAAAIEETTYSFPSIDGDTVRFTREDVRLTLAVKSKSGKTPPDSEIRRFCELCKARGLNPWVGDAFLIGYDCKDGTTSWSLVTAHQAFLKRAESHPEYAGMESGVLVWSEESGLEAIQGDVYPRKKLHLIGGWCRIHRHDRPERPTYKTAAWDAYAKPFGHWQTDGAWMICKCAEAKAIRGAFPKETGGELSVEELGAAEAAAERATSEEPVTATVRLGRGRISRLEVEPSGVEG